MDTPENPLPDEDTGMSQKVPDNESKNVTEEVESVAADPTSHSGMSEKDSFKENTGVTPEEQAQNSTATGSTKTESSTDTVDVEHADSTYEKQSATPEEGSCAERTLETPSTEAELGMEESKNKCFSVEPENRDDIQIVGGSTDIVEKTQDSPCVDDSFVSKDVGHGSHGEDVGHSCHGENVEHGDDEVQGDSLSEESTTVAVKDLNLTDKEGDIYVTSTEEGRGEDRESNEQIDEGKEAENKFKTNQQDSKDPGEHVPGQPDCEFGAAGSTTLDLPTPTGSTTLDLPTPDADDKSVTTEGSISSDSASDFDIELDVAIVTEEKTKKQTLAAVVKDENGEGRLLVVALSDASRFSYCSICAVSLGRLFDKGFDKNWREKTMKLILNHLKLPTQCEPAMEALMTGMGSESLDAFVDTLLKDPVLKTNPLLLPEDLVTLSVQHGSYDARMRVLIFHVAWHLRIRWKHLEKFEEVLVKMLKEHEEENDEQKAEREKKEKKKKRKRYALIGLATVGGGAAIGEK